MVLANRAGHWFSARVYYITIADADIGSLKFWMVLVNRAGHWYSALVYYITIADADIGSLKSLHTLFAKYLNHMLVIFEQNHMVQTT